MKRIIPFTLALMAASTVRAEPVGYRYEIMWGGFHAGDMAITRDDDSERVSTAMTIRTVGLFDKLLRLRFQAEGGSRAQGQAEALASEFYQTRFRNRYQERLLRVAYDGEARIVRDDLLESFAPLPEDDQPNPPVPPELRRGVADPLTNMAMVGRVAKAAAASGAGRFHAVSFDGRRAYDFDVTTQGPRHISIRGKDYDTIALTMTLKPLAGFKAKFLKLWDGAEYEVDVDPVTLLPVRIRTDSFAAMTVINALETCRVPAERCAPLLTARDN